MWLREKGKMCPPEHEEIFMGKLVVFTDRLALQPQTLQRIKLGLSCGWPAAALWTFRKSVSHCVIPEQKTDVTPNPVSLSTGLYCGHLWGEDPGESSWLARRGESSVETSEGQCWSLRNKFPLSKDTVGKSFFKASHREGSWDLAVIPANHWEQPHC